MARTVPLPSSSGWNCLGAAKTAPVSATNSSDSTSRLMRLAAVMTAAIAACVFVCRIGPAHVRLRTRTPKPGPGPGAWVRTIVSLQLASSSSPKSVMYRLIAS